MSYTVAGGFAVLADRLEITEPQDSGAKTAAASIIRAVADELWEDEAAFVSGSYRRRSIVRYERDVDVMAPLSRGHYERLYASDSRSFLYMVREKIAKHYPGTKVSSREVAIRVGFAACEVDLVPCFQMSGGGYLMPNGSRGWQLTNPPFHVALMESSNKDHSWRLKPLVRLMKVWNIANGARLGSFHLELMVRQHWAGRSIPTSTSRAVADTPIGLARTTGKTFPDPWPHGPAVDGYLTADRRIAAVDAILDDAERAVRADGELISGREESAYGWWRVVFGSSYWPAWG